MSYEFPVIKNISDVLPAIAGKEEFIVAERNGFNVINYLVNYELTFENPNEEGISEQESLYRTIRRECRGIIFDSKNGKILRRPMNKFFNLGEKEETRSENIDISKPHVILDKLDGSFIAPFFSSDPLTNADTRIIFGTKMGETDQSAQVDEFLKDKPNYHDFADNLLTLGYTPVFEFTSPANRIVINYKETKLTLLCVRDQHTGVYMPYDKLVELANKYDIPVVNALPGGIQNMEKFVAETRALQGEEGYVITFDDGLRLKLKSDEYVLMHKTKDSISQEKNLLELILTDKIDDTLSLLSKEDADKVRKYADSVLHRISEIASSATEIVAYQKILLNNEKKRFALEFIPHHKEYSGILFAVWDGKDARDAIVKQVLNNCSTQTKVNSVRQFLGPLIWNDIYTAVNGD